MIALKVSLIHTWTWFGTNSIWESGLNTEMQAEAPDLEPSPLPLAVAPELKHPNQEERPGVAQDVVNDHPGLNCR